MTPVKIKSLLLSKINQPEWREFLINQLNQSYFRNIISLLQVGNVMPEIENIFAAFNFFPPQATKVLILGQDPYHCGNADGLAFSCKKNISPSLRNILQEMGAEKCKINQLLINNSNYQLDYLAAQQVMLLNSALTVTMHTPQSHCAIWQQYFIPAVLHEISRHDLSGVGLIWGNHAKKVFAAAHFNANFLPIYTSHPSSYSAHMSFLGSNCFNIANQYLKKHNIKQINWLK